jgi:formylglycine-generating enzyme required for sulfatase activity
MSAPRIFFSYASEDKFWVEAFQKSTGFANVGVVRVLDYAAEEVGYGDLGEKLNEQIHGSAVVIAFVSSNYSRKQWTVAEWEKALTEVQRRRLVFVPLMLDADAVSWWQDLRKQGKLTVLSRDYAYVSFFDAAGRPLDIRPEDTQVNGKIARLAGQIRQDLETARPGTATAAGAPARKREESPALADEGPLTTAQERALNAGDSFKEGADCPEMVVVPAGHFLMGSPEGQSDYNDEYPQHRVTIARRFAVAKYALTFDEWDACAAQGSCRKDVGDSGWGRGRRPVINVSWNDAQAYVKWLSSITGRPYRLLSEAEWEYAARAGSQTKYPWGDAIKLYGKTMANCENCGSQWDKKQTAPVGSFAPNRFGLYDMIGNVWEWTQDCWNDTYQGAPADGSAWTAGDCNSRVVRGGSWYYTRELLRSALRDNFTIGSRFHDLGFRVARTLTP